MAVERCHGAIAAMLLAGALLPLARAAPPPAAHRAHPAHRPVPLALLEFLGAQAPTSHAPKSDSSRWLEYLSRLDLGKTAQAARTPAPAPRKPARGSSSVKKERGR